MNNQLTIVVADSLVIVDGYGLMMPINLPSTVHAVQWCNGQGEIEYNDGKPNEVISTLKPYKKIIEKHRRLKEEAEKPYIPTREEIATEKKSWRNSEIQNVSNRLDQYRNDKEFGTDTFPYTLDGSKEKAAIALNDYRLALIAWTDNPAFPDCEPPPQPVFLTKDIAE